jgi:hypothetical protein
MDLPEDRAALLQLSGDLERLAAAITTRYRAAAERLGCRYLAERLREPWLDTTAEYARRCLVRDRWERLGYRDDEP